MYAFQFWMRKNPQTDQIHLVITKFLICCNEKVHSLNLDSYWQWQMWMGFGKNSEENKQNALRWTNEFCLPVRFVSLMPCVNLCETFVYPEAVKLFTICLYSRMTNRMTMFFAQSLGLRPVHLLQWIKTRRLMIYGALKIGSQSTLGASSATHVVCLFSILHALWFFFRPS